MTVDKEELNNLVAGWQAKLGDMKHQIDLLHAVFRAAVTLSAAMVDSEVDGAEYEAVEEEWEVLTNEIQLALNEGISSEAY